MTQYTLYTGDKAQNVQVPTGYHDLTYGQFLRLRTEYSGDIGHLLEILTGVPRTIWLGLPVSEANKVMDFLQWIIDAPIRWDELPVPQTLNYQGKVYDIPKDLGLETFGQKIILESRITTFIDDMFKPLKVDNPVESSKHKAQAYLIAAIPYIVAVYMQPRVTGSQFDETKVEAVEQEILNCPAVQVYPIGNFFLRNFLGSIRRGPKPSLAGTNQSTDAYKKKPESGK